MRPAIRLRRSGFLTTVQDLGRRGLGRWGVSPSGAMDTLALRTANRLLDNADGDPALEITGAGAEIEFLVPVTFALAGANLTPTLDGEAVESWSSVRATSGRVLRFGARRQGARCYVALPGGVEVPAVFGSAATDLEAGIGGVDGRALRTGDQLRVGGNAAPALRSAGVTLLRAYASPFEIRVVLERSVGVTDEAREAFLAAAWRVSERSNRVGYRLDGPVLPAPAGTMLSEGVPPGAIQLPPEGKPIILMADRPTVGGYARLGCVIAADGPKTAQLWPGQTVRFRAVTAAEARAAIVELEGWLDAAVPR